MISDLLITAESKSSLPFIMSVLCRNTFNNSQLQGISFVYFFKTKCSQSILQTKITTCRAHLISTFNFNRYIAKFMAVTWSDHIFIEHR